MILLVLNRKKIIVNLTQLVKTMHNIYNWSRVQTLKKKKNTESKFKLIMTCDWRIFFFLTSDSLINPTKITISSNMNLIKIQNHKSTTISKSY